MNFLYVAAPYASATRKLEVFRLRRLGEEIMHRLYSKAQPVQVQKKIYKQLKNHNVLSQAAKNAGNPFSALGAAMLLEPPTLDIVPLRIRHSHFKARPGS